MEFIKPGTNINFVGRRKIAFAFSILLILIAIASFIAHGGLNEGIDFAGGILVQTAHKGEVTPDQIREGLADLNLSGASVQSFGERKENEFLIRVQETEEIELENLGGRIEEVLEKRLGPETVEIRRVEMVGPKVGADLREKALLALFAAVLFIAVYISGRFEMKWFASAFMAIALGIASYLAYLSGIGLTAMILVAVLVTIFMCWFLKLRFALGAVVAIIHDVVITVGILSLTGKEFTLPIVAALLAIIGYSLNDTIIVFDRIRENTGSSKRQDFGQVVNRAINETLSRTVLTSITTLLVVLALLFLGGGVIHDFAFTMLIGILVGTYSSIFVASPILLLFTEQATAKRTVPVPKPAPADKVSPVPVQANASGQNNAQAKRKKNSRSKKKKKKKKR